MSDIQFKCPYCDQHLQVQEEMSGQIVECPACLGQMMAPQAADMIPAVSNEVQGPPSLPGPPPSPLGSELPPPSPLPLPNLLEDAAPTTGALEQVEIPTLSDRTMIPQAADMIPAVSNEVQGPPSLPGPPPSPLGGELSSQPPLPLPNLLKDVAPAKGAGGPKGLSEELKQVYQDFAKPVGRSMTGFGYLMDLVAVAAIVVGVSWSWLWGIPGGIGILLLMVFLSNRWEAPHKKRAKEHVSQLEKRHAVSRQESFDLMRSTRAGSERGNRREWRTFVTAVWGKSAWAATLQQPQLPEQSGPA